MFYLQQKIQNEGKYMNCPSFNLKQKPKQDDQLN